MISSSRSIFSILIVAEFVLGNFANGFIALVSCTDWVKKQKISCADRILIALAVSRIGLLWAIAFNWYASVFNTAFYSSEVRTIVYNVWVVSNHFSLWLATSISILYLLKIANFSSLLFLHLKWKAKRVVIMILWGVWGTLVFLLCHLAVINIDEKMQMNEYEGNITWKANVRDIVRLSNIIVFTLVHFISFATSLIAVLMLIFSMWKHLKKMQFRNEGSQDPSTKVHIRAMQTVISFLLILVIYFPSQLISIWNTNILQNNAVFMLCQVFAILYPSGHSFILIWGNKKLRQAFLSFLWQLRCRLKERK
ncbi:PREDICTED: taste receptor type 2 member 43-like [Miniopterus natalensis]|uniref:taste receptor type 2 member 43-like n=1 Tax=Miniopterus natalensis TaxID=291302 RepID=UPI0007A70C1F|nr:PREDICTED: taste receptor type 2 member 43-like [Miniopterus natalensis]